MHGPIVIVKAFAVLY